MISKECNILRQKYGITSTDELFKFHHTNKNDAAFIHIPKTAGALIDQNLGMHIRKEKYYFSLQHGSCTSNKFNNKCDTNPGCVCSNWHVPPRYFYPNAYEDVGTFCVVRNPVDRLVSQFKMNALHKLKGASSIQLISSLNRYIISALRNEKDNYFRSLKNDSFAEDCHVVAQYEYVWDQYGHRTCDHILKYETYNIFDDVNHILDHYKQPTRRMNTTAERVTHHTQSDISRANISNTILQIVKEYYWKDMCLFGYDSSIAPPSKILSDVILGPHGSNHITNILDEKVLSQSISHPQSHPPEFLEYRNRDENCGDIEDMRVISRVKGVVSEECQKLKQLYATSAVTDKDNTIDTDKELELVLLPIPNSVGMKANYKASTNPSPSQLDNNYNTYSYDLSHGNCNNTRFNRHCSVNMACMCDAKHVPVRYRNPIANPSPESTQDIVKPKPEDTTTAAASTTKTTVCIVMHPVTRMIRASVSELHIANPTVMNVHLYHMCDNIHKKWAYNCNRLAQYEYVWDQYGHRTCDHILKYEDIQSKHHLGQLLGDLTNTNDKNTIHSNRNHLAIEELINNTDIEWELKPPPLLLDHLYSLYNITDIVIERVSSYYWRDMCLFDYDTDTSPYEQHSGSYNYRNTNDGCSVHHRRRLGFDTSSNSSYTYTATSTPSYTSIGSMRGAATSAGADTNAEWGEHSHSHGHSYSHVGDIHYLPIPILILLLYVISMCLLVMKSCSFSVWYRKNCI